VTLIFLKSGYVALFDVLGFSERVARDDLGGLDYIDTVVNLAGAYSRLGTILFSDTVVVYSLDESNESFHDIITVSSSLLHKLLGMNVPIRGAISYGSSRRSEHEGYGTVIAGRPIIEAHHYESRSQWVGIMLAPSLLRRRPDLSAAECSLKKDVGSAKVVRWDPDDEESELEIVYDEEGRLEIVRDEESSLEIVRRTLMIQPCLIPLEDESRTVAPFEGFAIVPVDPNAQDLREIWRSLNGFMERLLRLKELAPDARSQAKYRRSFKWLDEIHNRFHKVFGPYIP
jgi:hypothetical protein